jgi:sugar phosphate permease
MPPVPRPLSTVAASLGEPNPATDWKVWAPCFGMALCSWLSFVDRQVLRALAPTILEDTGLDAGQFAVVNSYFFVAYTVANPLWGTILDYVGLRVRMLMGVAIWTIASVSHGWMAGLVGFALCPLVGIGVWLFLTASRTADRAGTA